MDSAQKKLDFDSHDESAEEHAFDDKFSFPEDHDHDHLMMGLTSSPLSRKLQLQSPRKIKRHINFNFHEWKDSDDASEADVVHHPMLPPSPVSSRTDVHKTTVPPPTFSPPYKRVRALRLFDTPVTPKTIYEKSNPGVLSRALLQPDTPRPIPAAFKAVPDKPVANTNPFTPDVLIRMRKRTRSIRNLHSL
jgi:hypothetical protein